MTIPHFVIRNSRLPGIVGRLFIKRPFAAWTFAYWTFLPGAAIEYKVLLHEHRHVQQFTIGWAIGLALWAVFSRNLWLVPLTVFSFPLLYGFASLVALIQGEHPYRGNLFEVDARKVAGEL